VHPKKTSLVQFQSILPYIHLIPLSTGYKSTVRLVLHLFRGPSSESDSFRRDEIFGDAAPKVSLHLASSKFVPSGCILCISAIRQSHSSTAPGSSTVTLPAGEASTESQTTAKEVKSTKHVPGSADTAWFVRFASQSIFQLSCLRNLFGREYCDAQKK
jgi:hypothetical protein